MMEVYRYYGDLGFCIGWRIIVIRTDTNLSVCFLARNDISGLVEH
jgi:hypothetical protein